MPVWCASLVRIYPDTLEYLFVDRILSPDTSTVPNCNVKNGYDILGIEQWCDLFSLRL